jgi:hypothetical protein
VRPSVRGAGDPSTEMARLVEELPDCDDLLRGQRASADDHLPIVDDRGPTRPVAGSADVAPVPHTCIARWT